MSFIGIDTRETPPLKKLLADLPQTIRDEVIDTVSIYLINVLRQNAPYRYVSRQQAYGKTFFSDKQRRFIMAALRDGRITIPHKRTQELSHGWKQVGRGETSFIANETPGAEYVVGEQQSRHEQMVGWKQVTQEIEDRESEITRRAEAAAQNAIRRMGG